MASASPAAASRWERVRGRLEAVAERLRPFYPALRIAGFVAAVAIVVVMGVRAAGEVDTADLAWWPLPLALAAAGLWWVLLARGWAIVAGGRTSRRDISLWCRTQALRFVPGGIWAPASRAATVQGGAAEKLAAVGGENVLALCAAVCIGGLGMGLGISPWWLALAPVLVVPLLAAGALRGRVRVTPERARRGLGNYGVAFLAYALHAVLVQLAVSGSVDVLAVAGAACLAWAAGLVVVIAPSGIGVRELVYVELLAGTMPHAELAAAAVTMRLVMIAAELGVLLVAGRPAPAPVSS